MIYTNY